MGGYLLRRLLLRGLTLFGMSVLIFIALRLVPGNIADILVDSAGIVDEAQKGKIEHDLGLARSLVVQYGQWIGGLLQGDLGYAYITERPAVEEIAPRLPVTAKLATLSLIFAVLIGVPLGVISAVSRTARSKGASEPSVNYDHALRNAMLPVITIIGIEAAFLIGGLIVTETVFNIPGVARFLVEAVRSRDCPIVQNLVMFIAVIVVTINFLVDMAYTLFDPRIRYVS